MNPDDVFTRVRNVLAGFLYIDNIVVSMMSSLRDDLDMDSLDLAEFVINIEDEFGIELPTDMERNLLSVADVVAYILNCPVSAVF